MHLSDFFNPFIFIVGNQLQEDSKLPVILSLKSGIIYITYLEL